MNEIFRIHKGSVHFNGKVPLLVTAASQQSNGGVVSTAILFSRFPNGEDRLTRREETLNAKPGLSLPDLDWTEMMVRSTEELVISTWTDELYAVKDPVWNEYLNAKLPMPWIEQNQPEIALLSFILHASNDQLDRLSALAHSLPHPIAARVFKQSVEQRLKIRIEDF